MGDKCGSCNQYLQKEPLLTSPNSLNINNKLSFDNSFSPDNLKFQLKNIQDFSNKLGFGSYSRIISNYNSEGLEEINQALRIKNNQSSILPDINKRGGSNFTNKNKNKSNINISLNPSIDLSNTKMNNIIFNELDVNKRIKGEDLLKAVDKYQNDIITTNTNTDSGKYGK